MSWMDSWSRPGKHAAVPPPFYITSGEGVPYCHTCGRVMNSRKSQEKQANTVKYCSDRCRTRRPKALDRSLERKIASLLDGETGSGFEKTAARSKIIKGDHRIIVTMEEIEEIMFGNRKVPTKTSGHRKTRASRAIPDAKEWKSVDMESDQNNDTDTNLSDHPTASTPFETRDGTRIPSGLSIRPPQTESDVNFSVGGERGWAEKLEETDEAREKRLQGDRRAKEREMVRQAVRRVIVFGVAEEEQPNEKVEGQPRVKDKKKAAKEKDENSGEEERPAKRKAEAVMNGSIVDPSFAKGNWSVRWRERV